MKQYYQHMIAAVLDDNELAAENSPMDLENFDDDMSKMFKVQYHAHLLSAMFSPTLLNYIILKFF